MIEKDDAVSINRPKTAVGRINIHLLITTTSAEATSVSLIN